MELRMAEAYPDVRRMLCVMERCWGFFEARTCRVCRGPLPPMFAGPLHCLACDARMCRSLILEKMPFPAATEEGVLTHLAAFLVYDARHQQRLHFLWCTLLGRVSPFNYEMPPSLRPGRIWRGPAEVVDNILSFLM